MQKKIENLSAELLQYLRSLYRKRKNLLVLRLADGAAVVEYWQQGCPGWQEELLLNREVPIQNMAKQLAALEAALRALLLAKEVEENLPALLLPPSYLLQKEELQLPLLTKAELKEAVAWEAANAFAEGSYSYAYVAEEAADTCLLHLWGLPLSQLEELEKMAGRLLLQVEVVASVNDSELATDWYKGKALASFTRPKQAFVATPRFKRLLVRAAGAALLISLVSYVMAWAGCYLAQEQVQRTQEQLAACEGWRQRQQASAIAEKKIAQLEGLLAQRKAVAQQRMSSELERLSRAVIAGCWLTQITQERGSVQVQGRAVNMQVLQSFMDRLQQSGSYKSVNLRESQAKGAELEYSLQLEKMEGKP